MNLKDHREHRIPSDRWLLLLLVGLSATVIAFLTPDLDLPKYSWTGDEDGFFEYASYLAAQNFHVNPFAPGVYVMNSTLPSLYQALFLWVFGASNFWWRFSSILLILPGCLLLFLWVRSLFDRTAAFFASCFFLVSFYLQNFLIIGYVNPIGFVHLLAVHALCATIVFKNHLPLSTAALLGMLFGLGFYVFLGPLFPWLMIPYFVAFVRKTGWNRSFAIRLSLVAALAVLVALPGALNREYVKAASSAVSNREVPFGFLSWAGMTLTNLGLFWRNPKLSHFVYGSYLDFVSGVFAAAGFLLALARSRRKPFAILLGGFGLTCVLLALTDIYPHPPVTRGLPILGFGFVFAGLGLEWFTTRLPALPRYVFVLAVLFVATLANRDRRELFFAHEGILREGCIFMALQEAVSENPAIRRAILIPGARTDAFLPVDAVRGLVRRYGLRNIEVVGTASRKEILPTPFDFVINVTAVCEDGCKSRVPFVPLLPWLPDNL